MRIIPIRVATALVLVAAAGLPACSGGDGGSNGKVQVVASFFPLAEMARAVGGADVEVSTLTPPGVEPHDLELSTGQVGRATEADVLLYLGAGFQPAVADLAERAQGEVRDLLAGLPLVDDDPHVWLDPSFMRRMSVTVQGALARVDPDNRPTYTANAARYREGLARVDREFEAGLADCERNVVVTSHAAYRYLTSRYGLEQEAVTGADPEAEPSPARLAELATLIREGGVTTVFTEPLVTGGPADALARETGTRTAVLDPVEGPAKDAPEAGWAGLMRRNLAALRSALGCR
jgi:zinc transport system substrate-binding protein